MSAKGLQEIAVVGLGLMGSSIIVSLLNSGCKIIALTPLEEELKIGKQRISEQLISCHEMGLLKEAPDFYAKNLTITADYSFLKTCDLVIECVIELEEIKKLVYERIESNVSSQTIIASNTSAIPISTLQRYLQLPSRFLGIHWAEPAFATRFLEITCGDLTDHTLAEMVSQEAESWGKEPTLLYKDIRGFITNRLMYAVYREAFHLLNTDVADMSAIDKCFQYDFGSWISVMGIFKRMDFLGLQHSIQFFENILPRLSNTDEVPLQMQIIAETKGRGVHNLNGLFAHTQESAKELEKSFAVFNSEIFQLLEDYRTRKNNLNI